jgi:hypothetical protein
MKISWLHHAVSVILLWTETFANDRSCDPSKWKLPVDAKYDTAGKISNAKLNVHLIPHSHDDP